MRTFARARFVRVSSRKAGVVLEQIRGKSVADALATLQYTPRIAARLIEKVLRSAIANASQKDGFGGDVERLYVNACYANQGPSQKRIRPAPMGRAFRIVKRTAHLTVQVTERPTEIAPVTAGPAATPGEGAPKRPRGAKPKPKAAPKRAKGATKKTAGGARKKTAAKGRAKKAVKS